MGANKSSNVGGATDGSAFIACVQWQLGQPGGHSRPSSSFGQSSAWLLPCATATTSATTCGMPVICTAVIATTRRIATTKTCTRRMARWGHLRARSVGAATRHCNTPIIATKRARRRSAGASGTDGRVARVFRLPTSARLYEVRGGKSSEGATLRRERWMCPCCVTLVKLSRNALSRCHR